MAQAPVIWDPDRWLAPVAPTTLPDGSTFFLGCTYAAEMGYRPVTLDLRIPAGVINPPLVVYVHGGAWMFGDRRYLPPTLKFNQLFDSFISAGIAVATVDYRHAMEAPHPAQIHDVKAAIRYLRYFSDTFLFDSHRIGIMGESAGGHIASFVALTHKNPQYDGKIGIAEGSVEITACVNWYGVNDFTIHKEKAFTEEQLQEFSEIIPEWAKNGFYYYLFGGQQEDQGVLRAASSLYQVSGDAQPMLLQHGDADIVVPVENSYKLYEALLAQGIDVELDVIKGADHIWEGKSPAEIAAIIDRSVQFLAKKLTA